MGPPNEKYKSRSEWFGRPKKKGAKGTAETHQTGPACVTKKKSPNTPKGCPVGELGREKERKSPEVTGAGRTEESS